MHVQSLKQFVTTTINCKRPREVYHILCICRFSAFYCKTALFPQKGKFAEPLDSKKKDVGEKVKSYLRSVRKYPFVIKKKMGYIFLKNSGLTSTLIDWWWVISTANAFHCWPFQKFRTLFCRISRRFPRYLANKG